MQKESEFLRLMPHFRHKSMIAYLSSVHASQSAAALREELQIPSDFDENATKKYEGLLEKKWTSVARLQRKVRRGFGGLE